MAPRHALPHQFLPATIATPRSKHNPNSLTCHLGLCYALLGSVSVSLLLGGTLGGSDSGRGSGAEGVDVSSSRPEQPQALTSASVPAAADTADVPGTLGWRVFFGFGGRTSPSRSDCVVSGGDSSNAVDGSMHGGDVGNNGSGKSRASGWLLNPNPPRTSQLEYIDSLLGPGWGAKWGAPLLCASTYFNLTGLMVSGRAGQGVGGGWLWVIGGRLKEVVRPARMKNLHDPASNQLAILPARQHTVSPSHLHTAIQPPDDTALSRPCTSSET